MEKLVLLLSPFAPHIAEELWQALGHQTTLAYEPWPTFDEAAIREDTIEVPVQINGKLRWRIQVPAGADKAALESAARSDPKIAELLAGKTVVKAIVVPGRMVNFVVKVAAPHFSPWWGRHSCLPTGCRASRADRNVCPTTQSIADWPVW